MMTALLWLVLSIFSTIILNGNLAVGDFCGFTSAVTETEREFIVLEDQPNQWTLQMNFSWTRPSGSFDGYYIKLVDAKAGADYGCSEKEGYLLTVQTWHLFDDLNFGFSYEVHIRLYNSVTDKTSFIPERVDIDAPDCYEQTESIEYCTLQPIPTTTKVRSPRVELIELNNFGNGTDVVISWLPPVQINGDMDTNSVAYRQETAFANEGVIQFHPADVNWNGDRWERFNTTLPSLLNNTIYIVTIRPIVTQTDDRVLGEVLDFRVNTSLPTDSDSQSHAASTTTPHQNTPDYVTNVRLPISTKTTESEKTFFSRLSVEWLWAILCIIPAIILLCAVFVLLLVRRKSQQMNVVSS